MRCSPVAPCARVCHEREGNPGGKWTGGCGHQVAVRVRNVSPSHRHDLCDDPEERLLEAHSNADKDLADNKSVDIFGNSTDDATNQGDATTDDEEPGESSVEREMKCRSERNVTIFFRKCLTTGQP